MRIPIDTVLLAIGLPGAAPGASACPEGQEPETVARATTLLAVWRQCEMPVLHVRDERADRIGADRDGVSPLPDEAVVAMRTGNAFAGTNLEERLDAGGHTTLVVCGAETDDAVAATARHAASLGFRVFVAADACWTVDRAGPSGETWPATVVHHVALAGLHGAYATIVDARSACEAAALIASRRR